MIDVNGFAKKVEILKEKNLINDGVIVSYIDFTEDEKTVAAAHQIKLLTFKELKNTQLNVVQQRGVVSRGVTTRTISEAMPVTQTTAAPKFPEIFVIIPFKKKYDDVYKGIQTVANSLSVTCEKADEKAFVGQVMDRVYEMIKNAKIIIAELTPLMRDCGEDLIAKYHNPNVYYELGYAHALSKQVIMLTNDMKSAPFDVQGYSQIPYKSIRNLKPELEKTLRVLLNIP
jgi:hypothetical protein